MPRSYWSSRTSFFGFHGLRACFTRAAGVLSALLVLSLLTGPGLLPTWAAPAGLPVAIPTIIRGHGEPTPTATPTPTPDDAATLSQAIWFPDGSILTVGTGAGIFLYDAVTTDLIRSITGESSVTSLAYSPDGSILGAGTIGGAVQWWRVSDGEPLLTIQEQAGAVNSVAFTPDGWILAAGYEDGAVRLWGVDDGGLLGTLKGHAGRVGSVAFAPDGALLASGSGDGAARLWRMNPLSAVRSLKVGPGEVNSVVFSFDATLLATGSGDGTVRLFRVRDGALLRTLQGHRSSVTSVAFSPDGTLLASASADGNARLWRAADGASLRTLPIEGAGPLASVAFTPDGATLAIGAVGGQVKLIAVQSGGAPVVSRATGAPLVSATEAGGLPPPTATGIAPAQAGCVDGATFVGDVTVPDNTWVAAGAPFSKIWRLRNAGTCAWSAGYRLAFLSGDRLGAPASVAVALTQAGATADIAVAMQAPAQPGVYSGLWQMMNPAGQRFGQRFTVVIQAPFAGAPPAPTQTSPAPPPPPPPPGPVNAQVVVVADRQYINAGECTIIRADVQGVTAAWLDGEPVVGGHKEKQVCPCANSAYELTARLPSGGEARQKALVVVNGVCGGQAPPAMGAIPTATSPVIGALKGPFANPTATSPMGQLKPTATQWFGALVTPTPGMGALPQ